MQSHKINISRTARYCTLGELNAQTRQVWFVLHGYGQLAPYFLKKFEVLEDEKTFVVAPEALSRFYLQGFSGRVGATWMTREERLDEITDYVHYLNQLYAHLLADFDGNHLKINILGFSQGVATVCRWVLDGQVRADRLVLYAGIPPDDLNPERAEEIFRNLDLKIILGEEDEMLNNYKTQLENWRQNFEKQFPQAVFISFPGGHEIDPNVLKTFFYN
jgi:predicted esterase